MNIKRTPLEKLAFEAVDKIYSIGLNDEAGPYADGYIAGFKEARAMASQFLKDSWNNPKYFGMDMSIAMTMVSTDLESLGEETTAEIPVTATKVMLDLAAQQTRALQFAKLTQLPEQVEHLSKCIIQLIEKINKTSEH